MAIQIIPNQQFIFDQILNDCATDKYCQLVQNDDLVKIQIKQSPCGANVVSNFGFATTLGGEIIVNGDFSDIVPPPIDNWVLANGATAGTAPASVLFTSGGANQLATQTTTIALNTLYEITVVVHTMTTGYLQVLFGNDHLTDGGFITSAGTYTYQGFSSLGVDLILISALSNARVTSVSVKAVTATGWTSNNNFISYLSGTGVCHQSGTATTLTASALLTNLAYYMAVITISNRTQGNVTVEGSNAITGNGSQDVFFYAAGTGLDIVMSSDFDGCINSVYVYPLRTDFEFLLYDLDNNFILDVGANGRVIYNDEYVTMIANFNDKDLGIDFGCYKFKIVDNCISEIICDSSFTESDCAEHPWDLDAGVAMVAGDLVFTDNGTTLFAIQELPLEQGACYTFCYNVKSVVISPINISIGNFSTQITLAGVKCFEFTHSGSNELAISQISGSESYGFASSAEISSVTMKPCLEYESNCMNFKASFPDSVRVEGDSDEDYSLNFRFNIGSGINHFSLVNRFYLSINNPTYPQEEEDYLFSSGKRSIQYAMSEKYYTVSFHKTDEAGHDNIRALIMCDRFTMDQVEYFVKKGEYKPLWERRGEMNLAESRIEVKKKYETLFNKNI